MIRTRTMLLAVTASLPLLFFSHSKAFAATLFFRGKVIDTNNNPVSGASITNNFYGQTTPYQVTTDSYGLFNFDKIGFALLGSTNTITVGETALTLAETFPISSFKIIRESPPVAARNSNYPNPDIFQVKSKTAVPEPLTIFGSGMALGFSILMQRKYSQKKG